ncbi:rod shape-determining protein MreD [uncultured Jannaschia sp.]|uniref:rod shape-determining protein MreD n=1 Tax=uncultured Jannaschia sp. TaxID=293347 RepID=UPI002611A53A|nr:rod shape-determining protein MreD [uncultured Jannaschia sp.]
MFARRVLAYRLTFAGLAFVILFFALLPFGSGEGGVPGPELTVCLICAWVLRRPDYVPVWLIVPLLLLDDALLMRPLGLWTLIVLLLSEYLRRRVDHAEALPFWSEAGLVASCILAAFLANHLALVLLFAETPPLIGQGLHALATIVFYPPVAVFSQLIGVRRLAPGELDSLGTRA